MVSDENKAKIDRLAQTFYHDLVAREGLYGKAFYGHRKTKKEARRINHLWAKAQKIAEGEVK